ncbi:hypothetical protein Ddc_22779 [Ditylenchus destructor]|nr:hypothetical protein Ddc_22779 [Ditylenchus destructor]
MAETCFLFQDPHNFIESHMGMDLPSQSAFSRKRQLSDNVSNDSVESRKKRSRVMNDNRNVNHNNAYGPSHALMNAGIVILKDQAKEVELNKMVDQCHRFPIQQIPSNDSIELLSGVKTSTGIRNTRTLIEEIQECDNDDDVIMIEDVNETTAMSNNSSDGNLSEQPTQTDSDDDGNGPIDERIESEDDDDIQEILAEPQPKRRRFVSPVRKDQKVPLAKKHAELLIAKKPFGRLVKELVDMVNGTGIIGPCDFLRMLMLMLQHELQKYQMVEVFV